MATVSKRLGGCPGGAGGLVQHFLTCVLVCSLEVEEKQKEVEDELTKDTSKSNKGKPY